MPFPLEALPTWLRSMVEALGRSTQTDPGMAAVFSLGVLSAAVSRRYALQTPRGTNHLNLWVIVVAESGEGKSSVLSRLTEPLDLIQQAAQSASPDLPRPRIEPPSEPLSVIERLMSDDDIIDGPRPTPEIDATEVLRAMEAEQERRYRGVPLNPEKNSGPIWGSTKCPTSDRARPDPTACASRASMGKRPPSSTRPTVAGSPVLPHPKTTRRHHKDEPAKSSRNAPQCCPEPLLVVSGRHLDLDRPTCLKTSLELPGQAIDLLRGPDGRSVPLGPSEGLAATEVGHA